MAEKVVIGNAELWHGDCREVLPTLGHRVVLCPGPGGAIVRSGVDRGVPDAVNDRWKARVERALK